MVSRRGGRRRGPPSAAEPPGRGGTAGAAGQPGAAGDPGAAEPRPGVLRSRAGTVQEVAESAAPRFVGVLAIILPVVLLIQTLANLSDYRLPAVPVIVWLGMLATAAWLVPRAPAGLSAAQAGAAIAVAMITVTAIGLDRRVPTATPAVDWTVLGTIWLLALVALSRPARMWVPGAALVLAAHAFFMLRLLGLTPPGLARAVAGGYSMVVVLTVVAVLRPTLRTHAGMAVRRAELASRTVAERAAVDAIREDRRGWLALLEVEALPLLRGIADGTLDPADSAVRRDCAQHAATLRSALVDRSRCAGGLLAGLEPALQAAQSRGLPVEVQVVGDPGYPTRDVARATLATIDLVLRMLPPQPVTLTVLASGTETELYLTFEQAPPVLPGLAGLDGTVPAGTQWRAAVEIEESGSGCLEVRWRRQSPATVLA